MLRVGMEQQAFRYNRPTQRGTLLIPILFLILVLAGPLEAIEVVWQCVRSTAGHCWTSCWWCFHVPCWATVLTLGPVSEYSLEADLQLFICIRRVSLPPIWSGPSSISSYLSPLSPLSPAVHLFSVVSIMRWTFSLIAHQDARFLVPALIYQSLGRHGP